MRCSRALGRPNHRATGENTVPQKALDSPVDCLDADSDEAQPVWSPHTTEYGNPSKETNRIESLDLTALDDVAFEELTGASLWAYVTGHGQGNAQNCAEFCRKRHWLTVDDVETTRFAWRDDCSTTAAPGQQGTWQYSRAGWCPGAKVHPWVADVSDALASSDGQLTVGHRVADYVNTCRPDASPCTGCALGTSCEYNGGSHTRPNYLRSALLVLYR